MKYLFTFLFAFLLNADHGSKFNYDLLIGSWSQKSIANSNSTGIFTFKKDSTESLEMIDQASNGMIGGMNGPYKIERTKGNLKITLLGKEKTFEIQELSKDVLVIQNKKEGKEKQIFKRYTEEK